MHRSTEKQSTLCRKNIEHRLKRYQLLSKSDRSVSFYAARSGKLQLKTERIGGIKQLKLRLVDQRGRRYKTLGLRKEKASQFNKKDF